MIHSYCTFLVITYYYLLSSISNIQWEGRKSRYTIQPKTNKEKDIDEYNTWYKYSPVHYGPFNKRKQVFLFIYFMYKAPYIVG